MLLCDKARRLGFAGLYRRFCENVCAGGGGLVKSEVGSWGLGIGGWVLILLVAGMFDSHIKSTDLLM